MPRAAMLLFCLCAAVLTPAPASAAKRVALVVGIDQYDNLPAEQQLKKAANDANALGDTLKGLGYQVIVANNADRRGFNESWQKFLSLVEPGDEAAFFFAGHGIEIAGQNYLLPRDVPKPESGEASLVKNESLSVTQLLADLQDESPRVSLVILDACRDNPFAASGTRSVGGTRGLARVEAPEGTFVMYSAGAGQAALDRLSDNDKDPNSVFTRSLVPLIKTKGLGMQEVALKVREQVVSLANGAGHKQTPAYYDQVIGRFCVAGCEPDGEAAKPAAVPPPALPAVSTLPPIAKPAAGAAAVSYAWKVVGTGDCGGQDVSCSKAARPVTAECNAARLGRIAVCWTRGRNKGYPGFPGCQGGPKDWCTYKNLAPEQCRGGSNPGQMWVCSEE
jgi:caspase domain-containing protein